MPDGPEAGERPERPERPARPTIAELREVTQPPAVRGRTNSEHWVADVYLRRISPYLTRAAPADAVTGQRRHVAHDRSPAPRRGLALLIPGMPGAVLALLLGQMQMLWDCCDGEVARWRETFSPAGTFLDKVGHYTAESVIPVALGIRAAGSDFSWTDARRVRLRRGAPCAADHVQQGAQRHGPCVAGVRRPAPARGGGRGGDADQVERLARGCAAWSGSSRSTGSTTRSR